MEIISIITIIMVSVISLERIFKHIKKSSCFGSNVEFNNEASVPDFTDILINKKK